MKTYDAMVVLGGGRKQDGSLTELSEQRLDKAIELFKKGLAPKIIVPGGINTTYLGESNFSQTGAEVRRQYLLRKFKELDIAINEAHIIKVEEGGDTIPEAFAIRRRAKELNLKTFLLVTSDRHMKRALWIFRRIFGPMFLIEGATVPCGGLISEDIEREKLGVAKEFFRRMPKEIPDPNLKSWFTEHEKLYDKYREIIAKYPPKNGREWQAYMGVKRK